MSERSERHIGLSRRMFSLVAVLALALTAAVLPGSGRATAVASPNRGHLVTMCLAPKAFPSFEHTVRVPAFLVATLLRTTASYRGPCAAYGESAPRGDGRVTAYSQQEHGKPAAIGVVLPTSTLRGLPHDPPTDGKWCYDKNGDGTVDPMMECANGYGSVLDLDGSFRRDVETPFKYLMIDWNPHGHGPPNVYDRPHFDAHFYLQADASRRAIRPGPCPELVNCEDFELGKKLPAAKYRPSDFEDLDAQSPGMGNHLIDRTGPEFHGKPFTHTFIYGTWDRDVTFYEPMITEQYLDELADGTRDDACVPIKQAEAFQQSGWYPTRYCMRHRDNRDEITISLEGFVHRAAS